MHFRLEKLRNLGGAMSISWCVQTPICRITPGSVGLPEAAVMQRIDSLPSSTCLLQIPRSHSFIPGSVDHTVRLWEAVPRPEKR